MTDVEPIRCSVTPPIKPALPGRVKSVIIDSGPGSIYAPTQADRLQAVINQPRQEIADE
jgi:hypothetical protein